MDESLHLTPESLLEHRSFVLALARRLVRDEAAAEDLAQETWLATLTHPPRPGHPRAWLARVLRSRAINAGRSERRRDARQRAVALSEAHEDAASARERLELQHQVVSAVLALDEPYRGIVIAVYYQDRTPQQVALERGVQPGTIRSQLSRGLAQLRARLDREHGSRAAWCALLSAWAERGTSAFEAPSASLPSGSTIALAAVAAVAVGVAGWIALAGHEPRPDDTALSAAAAGAMPESRIGAAAIATGQREPLQRPDAPVATPVAEPATAGPAGLPAMLERMRQVKSLLLARALEPEPWVVRELAWLDGLGDAGVARMIARERFGFTTDLPWLQGGGAFWSFTDRTHDYQSRPQIGLSRGARELASGFHGGADGLVLDLGAGIPFETFARDPQAVVHLLDPKQRAAWELCWRAVEVVRGFKPRTMVTELRKIGFHDDAEVEAGHTYLVRAISVDEFDVVAGVHVAQSSSDGVTFGWKLFESRPIATLREGPRSESASSLRAPPPDLAAMDDAALQAELDQLRDRGTQLLFDAPPAELAARAAELAGRKDAGLVRLVDRNSPWKEFARVREGGCFYSFATRSHDYDQYPDLMLEEGRFSSGFYGGTQGWLLDLGDLPIERVERASVGDLQRSAWEFLWNRPIFSATDRKPAESLAEAAHEAHGLGLESRPEATVGRTVLVRSALSDHHDHLVAIRVLVADEYGLWIEWRIAKSFPPPETQR